MLLVDFQSLHKGSGSRSGDDQSADLRGLFRDADMNDAIIFFDECESIFAKVKNLTPATVLSHLSLHEHETIRLCLGLKMSPCPTLALSLSLSFLADFVTLTLDPC